MTGGEMKWKGKPTIAPFSTKNIFSKISFTDLIPNLLKIKILFDKICLSQKQQRYPSRENRIS